MLKKFLNEDSFFSASYFMEAPGDDKDTVSVTVAPRKNRGTTYDGENMVTVGPRINRGSNYSDDNNQKDEENDDSSENSSNNVETYSDDTATDYSDDGDDVEQTDDLDEDNSDGEEAPDEPDVGDDATDYSDDGDIDDSENDTNDDISDTSEEDEPDAEKKYHMYKRFVHLYNLLENFIEKCRNVVKSDVVENAVIKTVTNNFLSLYENLFDFMTIKYKTSSYIKILLYFETIISTIQLNIELLKNNKINLKQ